MFTKLDCLMLVCKCKSLCCIDFVIMYANYIGLHCDNRNVTSLHFATFSRFHITA